MLVIYTDSVCTKGNFFQASAEAPASAERLPPAEIAAVLQRAVSDFHGIERAEVLGLLGSMPVYTSDYRLFPYVAAVHDERLRPEPAEVAEVLRLDLAGLIEPGAIEGIPYRFEGVDGMSPLFHVGANNLVFGATAHTLLELLTLLAPLATGDPLPTPRRSAMGWQDVFDWAVRTSAPETE